MRKLTLLTLLLLVAASPVFAQALAVGDTRISTEVQRPAAFELLSGHCPIVVEIRDEDIED